MVFNATFILFYWWSKPRINNVVSSNKGVLIADIYIRTTVYINLKNTPPSKPQSIELEIRLSFSTEGYNYPPPKRVI